MQTYTFIKAVIPQIQRQLAGISERGTMIKVGLSS